MQKWVFWGQFEEPIWTVTKKMMNLVLMKIERSSEAKNASKPQEEHQLMMMVHFGWNLKEVLAWFSL